MSGPKYVFHGGTFPAGFRVRMPDDEAAEELRESFDAEAQRAARAAGAEPPPPVTVRRKGGK